MALGIRVKQLRESKGLSQAELANKVGVSQTAIHLLEQRDSKSSKFLVELATALSVTPDFLKNGEYQSAQADSHNIKDKKADYEIPASDEYIIVPQYDIKAACGNGYLNDYVKVKGGLAFKREWIKNMGWQADKLCVLYAANDSMASTINDGAIVLINLIESEPRSGMVYLINWYGEERIKRVFKDGQHVFRFSSDNTNKTLYPDERVDLSTTDDVKILGRVVWQAGTL